MDKKKHKPADWQLSGVWGGGIISDPNRNTAMICPTCRGCGYMISSADGIRRPCVKCNGTGRIAIIKADDL